MKRFVEFRCSASSSICRTCKKSAYFLSTVTINIRTREGSMDGSSLRPAVTRSSGKAQTRFAYPIVAAAAALVALGFGLVGYMAYTTARDTLARQIDTEIRLTGLSAVDGIQKWLSGREALVQG